MKRYLILLIFLSMGCAAALVGGATAVGTYTYISGQLIGTYNANLETTYHAVISGCNNLNLPIHNRKLSIDRAFIAARDGSKDVWINIKTQTSTTTKVAVRVGYLGDEFASQKIHDAISKEF